MEKMGGWENLTDEELERHMSPSLWNPNKTPEEVINQHYTICCAETDKAKQKIPHEANIAYGTGEKQKFDLYGTNLSDEAPIFFWIHGGYWQEGTKDMSAEMAYNFYEIGVKTIVLGYTLAPKATLPEIKCEVYLALKHAMEKFNRAKFFIGGHSAGAHLTANLLHDSLTEPKLGPIIKEISEMGSKNRILGLLLFAGVFDLQPLVPTSYNKPLKLNKEEAKKLSPLHLPFNTDNLSTHGIVSKDVEIMVLVGKLDSPEFQRQSKEYHSKLGLNFQNVQFATMQDDDHFTIVEGLANSHIPSSIGSVTRMFLQRILLKH